MRILPIILSAFVHVAVIAVVIFGGGLGGHAPIDITQQVYSVDIVGTPGLPVGQEGSPEKAAEAEPEGGPAKPAPKEVAATPEPEAKPEPQPAPEAKPVEKGKVISAEKKDQPEKPEVKPEPPKPEKKEVAEKKPDPPKPEPKTEKKPEPEKKTEPPKKKVAKKPKPKQPTSRDVIASALNAVQKEAADQAAADRAALERELEALRGSVSGQGQGSGPGRGSGGGRGGGGGADPLMAYGNYVKNLIKQYWSLPPIIDRSMNYAAVVRVTVDRRGNIQQFYVQTSSGRQDFDLSTIKAIKMAQQNAELEPPPVNGDIALNITFNSQEM